MDTRFWAIAAAVVVLLLVAGLLVYRWSIRFVARNSFVLARSRKPEERLQSLEMLAWLACRGIPNTFETLDRATEDPDSRVSATADHLIDQIGRRLGRLPVTQIPDQGELDRLKAQLLNPDDRQQSAAAQKLRDLGDPWLYSAGIQLRIDTRGADCATQWRVVRALGLLGDPKANGYLRLLLADPDPMVRCEAKKAVERIMSYRAV